MANKLNIPVEIDYSKGLADIASFVNEGKKRIAGMGGGASTGGDGVRVKVGVDADLSLLESAFINAVKPIGQLEDEIRALEGAIKKSTDVTQLKRFNDQIGRLQSQINNLKVIGFESSLSRLGASAATANTKLSPLPNIAGRATSTLVDMGRVLQDMPYGFIGIANNLNPLLEGFQRLQKESNGTKGAMRELLRSMTGAGGIGLALSAVTAALSFATMGFGAWTRGLSTSSKAAKDTKDQNAQLADSIKQITAELSGEVTRVTTLYTALSRGGLSVERRKTALEELKKINSDYFGSLKDEKDLVDKLKSAYEGYLNAIIEIGRTKAIEAQLTKLFDKKLQLELSIDPKFQGSISSAQQKLIGKFKKELADLGGPVDANSLSVGAAVPAWNDNNSPSSLDMNDNVPNWDGAIKKQETVNDNLQRRIFLQQQINSLQRGDNVLFTDEAVNAATQDLEKINLQIKGLTGLLGSAKIKIDPTVKTPNERDIVARAKEVANYLQNETTFVVNYEFSPLDSKEEAKRKAKAFLDEVDSGRFKLRPLKFADDLIEPPKPAEITEILTDVQKGVKKGIIVPLNLSTEEFSNSFIANINQVRELKKLFDENNIKMPKIDMEASVGFNYNFLLRYLDALLKTRSQLQQIANTVSTTLTPAFESMFDAILSGRAPMEGFFNALKQSVNQLIARLISAAIQAAILSAITGGKGGKSFGKIFMKTLGLASGGLVGGPTLSLVGEGRGTNAYNPEVVTPLDRLKSFFNDQIIDQISGRSGGAMVSPISSPSFSVPDSVRIVLNGDELVGFLSFMQQSQNRRT